jgi:HlyD family secretion protein
MESFWTLPNSAIYRMAKVERGDITTSVSATGTLNPVIMVQVGTQVSGTIEKLFVTFNTMVHVGHPLAQLDQASFHTKVVQAEASLNAARAEVRNALANVQQVHAMIENTRADVASQRANLEHTRVMVVDARRVLDRQEALFERRLLARHAVETAQTAHAAAVAQQQVAQAQIESAEAKLRVAHAQLLAAEAQVEKAKAQSSQAQAVTEEARVNLERTVIRSPINGVVISRSVDVGQTVVASLQTPTLFTLAQDLTRMQVDTNISEADIGTVAVGQSATFTVDAYPGQVLHGTVQEIRSTPIVAQNVVHYNAVLAAENPELKLKPGMTATVAIRVAQHGHVLKVPKTALRFQPPLPLPERLQFATRWQERQGGPAREWTGQASDVQLKLWQSMPKVWIRTPEGMLQPIAVRLGINDDHFSELTDDSLQEGQELIVGLGEKQGHDPEGARSSSTSRSL